MVIRRYGLLNTQVAPDQKAYGVPYPGTLVLDTQRHVIARFFEPTYRTRMTGKTLALRLGPGTDAAAVSALRVAGDHLDATLRVSDAVVAPGQEFMVTLDVALPEGVHVYAPGNHGYRPLRLVLDPDTLFTARPATYPPAEDYYFKPLDEHVPVFAGDFRVLVPVALEASRPLAERAREPGATVTLNAHLEYQACDDAVCFIPASIPVQVTLGLRPLEK